MSASAARFAAVDYAAVLGMGRVESQEGLAAMERALLDLEAHPDDELQVRTLFRLAYALKGNAASLSLAELTHAVEDIVERLRSQEAGGISEELVELLLRSLEAVGELLAEARRR